MNKKFNDYSFVFHATDENRKLIVNFIKNNYLTNSQVISDENIKSQILSSSVFAVAKSGTVSLEICNANIPSIIIYKINMINYWIMKFLVKVNFANIINIINNKEVIPELLQSECNAKEIFNSVNYLLGHPDLLNLQLESIKKTLKNIKSETPSTEKVSTILSQYL
jgi:lipid-A-disaccharide synthase